LVGRTLLPGSEEGQVIAMQALKGLLVPVAAIRAGARAAATIGFARAQQRHTQGGS
jgi:hypothetical protein